MLRQTVSGASEAGQVLKTTLSICPECNMVIPAEIIGRDGKIFLEKECPVHGRVVEVYYGDEEIYKRFSRYTHDGKGTGRTNVDIIGYSCPANCGLCPGHLSHTALANIVVTNRCDLYCWYCLPPDEELIIRQGGDNTLLVSIEELAQRFFNYKQPKKAGEGEYVVPNNVEVLTFNSDGRAVWCKVGKIFRRRYEGTIYELITRTGRRIKLTGDHRVLVVDGKKIVRKAVQELKVKDRVLVINSIPLRDRVQTELNLFSFLKQLPSEELEKIYLRWEDGLSKISHNLIQPKERVYQWNYRGSAPLAFINEVVGEVKSFRIGLDATDFELPTILNLTSDFMELVGYFISDGHYTCKDLRITIGDTYISNRIEKVLQKLGIPYNWLRLDRYNKTPQIVIGSRLLRLIFLHLFKIPPSAENKRIPRITFDLPLKLKLALLSGLFNGDGYVTRAKNHCSLGYATTSRGLARDILYLLASIGIFARLHKVSKERMKGAKHDLYKIYISGEELEKAIKLFELKPTHLKKLENLSSRKHLRPPVFGDFIIDEVKEVVPVGSGGSYDYVYDLEVEGDEHSFIAGDGILVSNCFFFAERAGYVYEPSIEQIREMVRALRREYPVAGNSVQLTGGEPALRDDLPEIIRVIKEEGVDHVQLNTNGIRLSYDFEFFRKVKEAGVSNLYLSFDGVTPKTNPKNLWEAPKVIENARKLDVGVVLVPTVIRGVNDHEIGDIIRFGFKNIDVIRSVNFQPVSLTGRLTSKEREKYRITIPDCIIKIEEQTDGEIPRDAWFPVPACTPLTHIIEALVKSPKYELSTHFACGAGTYVFKDGDKLAPITQFIDIDGLIKYLQDRAEELESGKSRFITAAKILWDFGKYIREDKQPQGINVKRMIYEMIIRHDYKSVGDWHRRSLFIGMMHFQDKYNYDVERVMRCSIHYLMPDGRIIPFCAFNVIPEWYRDRVQRIYGIPIEEWERKTGRSVRQYYRRILEDKS
jgi:uncharacterized radical SAM superfamily Fe-S cluster-containing enzyme